MKNTIQRNRFPEWLDEPTVLEQLNQIREAEEYLNRLLHKEEKNELIVTKPEDVGPGKPTLEAVIKKYHQTGIPPDELMILSDKDKLLFFDYREEIENRNKFGIVETPIKVNRDEIIIDDYGF